MHDYEDSRMIIKSMTNRHCVYKVTSGMPDGTLLVFAPVRSREEADAIQKHGYTRIFACCPSMSYPAKEWIAADPGFWNP